MSTINVQVYDISTGSNVALANAYVVLYDVSSNTSTQLQTNASGLASFTGISNGNYRVYNTGIDTTGQNPPTQCGFPTGFTGTTTPRRIDVALVNTATVNFYYDKPTPWSAFNGGNSPNFGITTTVRGGVNLATGAIVSIPIIGPGGNNAIGYCLADNMIYGFRGGMRSDGNATNTQLLPPYGFVNTDVIGDCDENSYLYTHDTDTTFYCTDVNPYRTTYLRYVNPYNNFQEVLTSPYTITVSATPTGIVGADWSYVASVQSLVGYAGATTLYAVSLTLPRAYNIPVSGTVSGSSGISFSDLKNLYTTTSSGINKYFIPSTTIAVGSVFSSSIIRTIGDGCRACTAPVIYATPLNFKSVNKAETSLGDTLTYTVTIANTGLITGNNTVFSDTLPTGLSFVNNSIYVNNVQQLGTTLGNVNVGTLPLTGITTVTFQGVVTSTIVSTFVNTGDVTTSYIDTATSLPFTTTYTSNAVVTQNINPYITSLKAVNKSLVSIGDTLTYTISLINTGSNTANSPILIDTIPAGTSIITGSIVVNGTTAPVGSTLYPTGLTLPNISPGGIFTVTFNVSVVSPPSGNVINNHANLSYTYNSGGTNLTLNSSTNIVTTNIQSPSIPISKFVDKRYAECSDTLTYTIVIPNTGSMTLYNMVVTDTLPQNTTYIPNSAVLNGVTLPSNTNIQNPGIYIGTLPIGNVATITFKVNVSC